MNTEYLNEFLVLAETKSFWTASEKLFISQSTLSRHIRCLEDELGVTLLDRTSKKTKLTEEGIFFIPYARNVVTSQNEILFTFREAIERKKNAIRIGMSKGVDTILNLTGIITKFQKLHPDAIFNLSENYSTVLISTMSQSIYDFIFIRASGTSNLSPQYYCNTCAKDNIVAVMAQEHPLAAQDTVTLLDLKSQAMVSTSSKGLDGILLEEAFAGINFKPWIVFRGGSVQVEQYLKSSSGITTMFKSQYLEHYSNKGLVAINIVPNITADVAVLCNEEFIPPKKRQFLDFFLEHL